MNDLYMKFLVNPSTLSKKTLNTSIFEYSSLNYSIYKTSSSGISSNLVPGSIPSSGNPTASS